MNIGLVSVDSKIPNLALMKLASLHKSLGNSVEQAFPLAAHTYDRVYRAKVFDFTADDQTPWPCEVIDGGTGYDMTVKLPIEAENIYPDYELFGCQYALGRITRGCVRSCPWCVVPKVDGTTVRQVATLDDFLHDQDSVRLLDDNLTALPDLFIDTCHELTSRKTKTYFEALDIRAMTVDMARALSKVRRNGNVHFAFDTPKYEAGVLRGIQALKDGGFPLWAATFYVLIGFDTTPEEDIWRIELLKSLHVESFVMPFDKADPYQKAFARWVNHKAIFKTVEWKDYGKKVPA